MGLRSKTIALVLSGNLLTAAAVLLPLTAFRGRIEEALLPWLCVAILLVVAASTASASYFSRMLVGPLQQIISGVEEMTSGKWDLTQRFDARGRDEVAGVARCVNVLLAQLQGVLSEVAGRTSIVSGSSMELTSAASQMSCHTTTVSSESSCVAAAAEQLATNMQSMAATYRWIA